MRLDPSPAQSSEPEMTMACAGVSGCSEIAPNVLASIPVEFTESGSRGVLTLASFGRQPEIELLCDQAIEMGQSYEIAPVLPEWEGSLPGITAECTKVLLEELTHQVRMRITKPTDEFLSLLSPGSERVVTKPLRKKA